LRRYTVKVKVQIKVTVDGREVVKVKEVGEVTNLASAKQLEWNASEALARAAAELRSRAGVG
jgi:hypothetical protein